MVVERVPNLLVFKKLSVPGGKSVYIPSDIDIRFPSSSNLDSKDQHYLAYLPWDEKYIMAVPSFYQSFFRYVHKYLSARTTDVHTAICVGLLKQLLALTPQLFNEAVVYVGLIMHDCGWSQLSEQDLADSLSYSGLALSEKSLYSKQRHADLGAKITSKVLGEFRFKKPLTQSEKRLVEYTVLYHDIPKQLAESDDTPIELFLVCDADRLWSYTHDCFWQDTIRKDVMPDVYLNNLTAELDGYFYTHQGKKIAKKLLADRKKEVSQYPAQQG